MRRLANKIIENCLELAIELILFRNMSLFELNKYIYLNHVESYHKENIIKFADDAVYIDRDILKFRNKLNPDYTNYLLGCTQFISEHSKELKDKINKTQIYYKFEK